MGPDSPSRGWHNDTVLPLIPFGTSTELIHAGAESEVVSNNHWRLRRNDARKGQIHEKNDYIYAIKQQTSGVD